MKGKALFQETSNVVEGTPSGVNAMSQFATPELSLASQGTLSNSPVTSNPLLSIYAPTFPELPSPESSRGTPIGTPVRKTHPRLTNYLASNNEETTTSPIPRRGGDVFDIYNKKYGKNSKKPTPENFGSDKVQIINKPTEDELDHMEKLLGDLRFMLNSSDFSDIFDMIRQESDAKLSEGGAKSDKKSKKSKKRKISNSSRTNTNYNNNSTRSSKKSRMEVLVNQSTDVTDQQLAEVVTTGRQTQNSTATSVADSQASKTRFMEHALRAVVDLTEACGSDEARDIVKVMAPSMSRGSTP